MNFTKSDIRVKLAESRKAFRRIQKLSMLWKTVVIHRFKAVVNTIGGLLASRRVFCWLPLFFVLFLFDKFRQKHLLKHANKNKSREDCCSVLVTCKTVVFRFF